MRKELDRRFVVMLIGCVVHLASTQYYPMHNFLSRAEPLRCALMDRTYLNAFSFGTHSCESAMFACYARALLNKVVLESFQTAVMQHEVVAGSRSRDYDL